MKQQLKTDIMQLKEGSTLQGGKYRIIRFLGQGGFGITYLAEHTMLDTQVAIKEFFPKDFCDRERATSQVILGTANTGELVEKLKGKFIKEAKNIAKLHHPNIVSIQDIFEENNTAYYIMRFVEGSSLNDIIKKHGPLSEEMALRYIIEVSSAIAYMHSKSMNHLDIKPANIMVQSSDDMPVLIDFGTSKQYDNGGEQTSTMSPGITHGYAPIEQYRPGGVATFTPQTDIYALGATLYALLTGKTPPHYSEILEDGLPPLPSKVSSTTASAIEHAMEVRKNKRPASVEDFLVELSHIKEEPLHTLRESPQPQHQTQPIINKEESKNGEVDESTVVIVPIIERAQEVNDYHSMSDRHIEPKHESKRDNAVAVNGIRFVDLGLSVLWADRNVGASTDNEIGSFINRNRSDETNEVAELNFKGAKIPTIGQWDELRNECSWEWTELRGTGGYIVTGKNGNNIFLPFSGNGDYFGFCTYGRLFTRETFYKTSDYGDNYYFYFAHGNTYKLTKYSLDYSCPVRCVYKKQ